MTQLNHPVFQLKPFQAIVSQAKKEKKEIYLVGGFIRDLFLGRVKQTLDLDFSVSGGAIDFGRRLARGLKAGFVVLDKEHGCSRVIYKDTASGKVITFDFVDFRDKDFKGDLLKRDFTIDTLAASLPIEGAKVLDLYGASRDIAKKVIRVVDDSSFDEDPLRILRAFSLAAIFGFKIEPHTMRLIEKKKDSLKGVAGERMRDELFKILEVPNAWHYISLLDKRKVLELVIPQVTVMHNVAQGGYHHLDVWGHSMETVKKLEELLGHLAKNQDLGNYLNETMASDRKRRQLIKLAALLHDIGKPKAFEVKAGKTMFHGHERIGRIICDSVSEKLRLSTRERFALDTIIFWHLRPGYLADNAVLTKRAIHRFFRDTEDEAASVLLVSIADQRATRGPLATPESRKKHEKVSFGLLEKYFEIAKEEPFRRLIDGADLIKKCKLKPGPVFSIILDAVEEAQVEGSIKTKTEALALARKIAKKPIIIDKGHKGEKKTNK
jgi:poly(A) polymerase